MMEKLVFVFLNIIILINLSKQDIYLHNPRGANNRLNEKSANRATGNRIFDSQNNNRGGYNVGDKTSKAFTNENEQYQMRFFQSGLNGESYLTTEWTEQHGCGGNEDSDPTKQNCVLVLQYMCQDVAANNENDLDRLRDGLNTNRQDYTDMGTDDLASHQQRKTNNVKLDRGLQEPWEWYDNCRYRERNKNLFTADQGLKINNKGYSSAAFTRQNPGGDRNGYECPEERDYYPYWHPSMWKDIAVLTSNITLCDQIYKKNSFNIQPYYECVHLYDDKSRKHWSRYNNENDCKANNGQWLLFYNYLEKATPPVCTQASWSRSNHLGNTREGVTPNYTWTLPYFPSKTAKKCVFRIRYNISTDDYDPFGTDAKLNGRNSPVRQNPLVDVGISANTLRLAINTAQYGRVFQDRSHSFYLLPRTKEINDNAYVYNLNVRGKRGNIVQTYPAVEYDFVPNNLKISRDNLLHIQWTGSNTHNNGAPAGDGQQGDAGNGQGGTDRNNLVEVNTLNHNYPLPFESTSIWNHIELIGVSNINFTDTDISTYFIKSTGFTSKDLSLYFAASGYYQCISKTQCGDSSYDSKQALDPDLNNSPASFSGAVVRFKNSNKVYHYICSRNNNFSNRSQKGSITIA